MPRYLPYAISPTEKTVCGVCVCVCVCVCACVPIGVMEYAVGSTHVINGTSLISSIIDDTPLYQPTRSLWDNQTERGTTSQDHRYM